MTEIFDQAKAIADVKTPAFEIANDIRDTTAAAATSAPITINAPSVDVEALKAQMDNAYASHVESILPKPEADEPSAWEIVGAAFRTGNVVGSALSNHSLASMFGTAKPAVPITDEDIVSRVQKEGLGSPLRMPLSTVGVRSDEQDSDDVEDRLSQAMTAIRKELDPHIAFDNS